MKELVVISGKGGTGKTSLVGAIAAMAGRVVLADCDVDAADLHLILSPEVEAEHDFEGGWLAEIDPATCTDCDACRPLCRFDAIDETWKVDPLRCEGCGVCHDQCPVGAVRLTRKLAGRWFESVTRFGPMVHARLGIAQDNSGKLVAQIRGRAREIGAETDAGLLLVDGPPGIGCPVISSLTGADLVLVVTEPTQSGLHDLRRVLELANHFRIGAAVCVNKCDLNEQIAARIEEEVLDGGRVFVGRIPFDADVTRAMVDKKTLPEYGDGPAANAARAVWENVQSLLGNEMEERRHARL